MNYFRLGYGGRLARFHFHRFSRYIWPVLHLSSDINEHWKSKKNIHQYYVIDSENKAVYTTPVACGGAVAIHRWKFPIIQPTYFLLLRKHWQNVEHFKNIWASNPWYFKNIEPQLKVTNSYKKKCTVYLSTNDQTTE